MRFFDRLLNHFENAKEENIRGMVGEYEHYADCYEKIIDFKKIKDSTTIFDLGAGDGKVTEILSLRYPKLRFIAVDFSKSLLRKVENIETLCSDLRNPDINEFQRLSSEPSIAINFSVIQYLSERQYRNLMNMLSSICSSVYSLSIPDKRKIFEYYKDSKSDLWFIKYIFSMVFGEYGIDGSFWQSPDKLKRIAEKCGFKSKILRSSENKFRFDIISNKIRD